MTQHTVGAVVLAAGRSERMGRCKALLPWGDKSLLGAWIDALIDSGVAPVVVVLGHEEPVVRAEIEASLGARGPQVRFVRNPDPERTSLRESLLLGLDALPTDGAAFFTPVDVPVVAPQTLAALLTAWEAQAESEVGAPHFAAVPVYEGAMGHPVLAGPALVQHLFAGEPGDRVDELLAWATRRLIRVPVSDPRVALDLDTPEEYARAVAVWGGEAALDTHPFLTPTAT